MKKLLLPAALLLIMLSIAGCALAEEFSGALSEVVQVKENVFSCSYDDVKHYFILDLPEKTEGAPLVLLLHGYGNTPEAFRTATGFEQAANPLGYAAVYVSGAPNPLDSTSAGSWNIWYSGQGNDDVGFLTALAKYLQQEYSFDESRTFAAGFSNGAFMAHRLALEAGDTFAACVSTAGTMPALVWETRKERNDISFFQISGGMDNVVPKNSDGSAKYAKDPAIEDVMAYWAESNGLELCESEETGNGAVMTKCRSGENANQVWHLFINSGRHSWPSVKLNGIDANSLILEFFETVSR